MVQFGVTPPPPPGGSQQILTATIYQFPPPQGRRRKWLIVAVIVAVVLEIALQVIGCLASAPLRPSGISWITLQLAERVVDLQTILDRWNTGILLWGLGLNYFYAAACGVVFVLLLAEARKTETKPLRRMATFLLVLTVAAVLCDWVENTLTLMFVSGTALTDEYVELARRLAMVKFVSTVLIGGFVVLFFSVCRMVLGFFATTMKVIWAIRFPFFVTVLLCALFFVQQTSEIIRVLVLNEGTSFRWRILLDSGAAVLVSVGAWYFARLLLGRTQIVDKHTKYGAFLVRELPRLLGVAICFFLGLAAWCARVDPAYNTQTTVNEKLMGFCVVQVVLALVLYKTFRVRREFVDKRGKGREKEDYVPTNAHPFLLRKDEYIPVSAAWSFWLVFGLGFTIFPVGLGQWLTPLTVVLFGVGSWIPLGSFLSYAGTVKKIPFLTVLCIAACAYTYFDANDNHAVRRVGTGRTSKPMELTEYFHAWTANRQGTAQHPYPVFLVATEGGGIRAAADTAVVLGGLQDRNPGFYDHVFAISGVSGGSVGATVFSAYYKSCLSNGVYAASPSRESFTAFATRTFSQDYLSPVLGMALFPDLLQRFVIPQIPLFDRSRGLEMSFERSVTNQLLTNSFFKWHEPPGAGPALVLNATDVKTGRRVAIAPFEFGASNENKPLSLSDVSDRADISLSSAMVLSARFPIVTPAGYLIHTDEKGQTKHRLVDGGYYENSGTATLLDVLSVLRTNTVIYKFYVIRIGHALSNSTGTNSEPKALPKHGQDGFDELAPIFAVLNAREARGDDATQDLAEELHSHSQSEMIDFPWKEDKVALPLGWYISKAVCNNLRDQFEAKGTECERSRDFVQQVLKEWEQGKLEPPRVTKR